MLFNVQKLVIYTDNRLYKSIRVCMQNKNNGHTAKRQPLFFPHSFVDAYFRVDRSNLRPG